MKVEKLIEIKEPTELEIIGITIPSVEEAEQIPIEYREYNNWWWLRSPGSYQNSAANVYFGGAVHSIGGSVDDEFNCVRPALKIRNLKPSNLQVGDKFLFGGKRFVVVTEGIAFCLGDIGKHCFRADLRADDANDYEKSDLKQYVEAWFHKAIKEME